MAKILTDKELGQIVHQAINGDAIDCADAYLHFLEDLGDLIANHFGGERGTVYDVDEDDLKYTVAFRINDSVPGDGGVYRQFDIDVTWADGAEV